MYVLKTVNFQDLMEATEGTAWRIMQHIAASGRANAFERYAQRHFDKMGGMTLKAFSLWLTLNTGDILSELDMVA